MNDKQKKWYVVYTDDENDMMLVGDGPWELSVCFHQSSKLLPLCHAATDADMDLPFLC